MNYQKKYLKYKNKYINFKKQHGGVRIDLWSERYDTPTQYIDSPTQYIETIIKIANKYNRYLDSDYLTDFVHTEEYDENEIEYKCINTFMDLKKYIKKSILSEPPYGTIIHRAVLHNESLLILSYINKFFDYNFITIDSQPGLMMSNDNHIQRPYLILYGEKNRINKLYDIVLNHDFLAVIDYEDNQIQSEDFPSFTDINNYKSITLGTRHKKVDESYKEYYEIIFNDYFFTELIKIIGIL